MKYLLAFVRDQDRMFEENEDEMRRAMEAWNEFDRAAIEAGVMIVNEALELPKTATTLRISEGGASVTDGPFTETKEQLGGFCLIDCESLEDALDWAKRVPLRPGSAIEVRAIMDLSPFGYNSPTPGPVRHQTGRA